MVLRLKYIYISILRNNFGFLSHASKVMLKIFPVRLQQYMNCELPDVQAGLEKAGEPEINCQHLKSKRVPEKHLFLLY